MHPGRPEVPVPGLRPESGIARGPEGTVLRPGNGGSADGFLARSGVLRRSPTEKALPLPDWRGRSGAEHENRANSKGASGGKDVETLSMTRGVKEASR